MHRVLTWKGNNIPHRSMSSMWQWYQTWKEALGMPEIFMSKKNFNICIILFCRHQIEMQWSINDLLLLANQRNIQRNTSSNRTWLYHGVGIHQILSADGSRGYRRWRHANWRTRSNCRSRRVKAWITQESSRAHGRWCLDSRRCRAHSTAQDFCWTGSC